MSAMKTPSLLAVALLLTLGLTPPAAFGAGSCTVTTCTPDYAPPCGGSAPGTSNCGTACTVWGQSMGSCIPDSPPIACGNSGPGHDDVCGLACTAYGTWSGGCTPLLTLGCNESGPGLNNCGMPCTAYGPTPGGCSPTTTIACNDTGPGVNGCGQACIANGPSCTNWEPYGYIMPSDPHYGFPAVQSGGSNYYEDNNMKDLVGLVAKGNIIVGDYTSSGFQGQVLPMIDGSNGAKTRPYAIDATDADLGYHTGDGGGVMYDSQGRPLFSGNYTLQDMDGGVLATKPDGSPRHYYEASMDDAAFQALLSMPSGGSQTLTIDGILFTNHTLAGFVDGRVTINGSMVSRDDGLVFTGNRLRIAHDARLSGSQPSQSVALPFSIQRPSLCGRVTCPASGCTSTPPACQ
jgi:hypothetical protein